MIGESSVSGKSIGNTLVVRGHANVVVIYGRKEEAPIAVDRLLFSHHCAMLFCSEEGPVLSFCHRIHVKLTRVELHNPKLQLEIHRYAHS